MVRLSLVHQGRIIKNKLGLSQAKLSLSWDFGNLSAFLSRLKISLLSAHSDQSLLIKENNFCFQGVFSPKFYFDLFWNLFQSFWALMTYLCGQYKINILFWSLLTKVNNLHFIRFLKFQQVDRASLLCYFETLGTQMGYLQSIII